MKNDLEKKKAAYEKAMGINQERVIPDSEKTTLDKTIFTFIRGEKQKFEFKEDLIFFLKRLNPLFMKRFKEEQASVLEVKNLGSQVEYTFL